MAPKQKLKNNEVFFLCFMVACLFFSYSRFWEGARKTQLDAITRELATAQATATTDQLLFDKLSAAGRSPSGLRVPTSRDLLAKYEKSNDRFSKVMLQLSDQAGTPFTVTRFSTEKQIKVGPYTQTAISLEAQATFLTIGRFLETLDDSPLLTEVESIDISRVANDLTLCDAKIRLFSYVMEPSP